MNESDIVSTKKSFTIELTTKVVDAGAEGRRMVAIDQDGVEGFWTMIFDEAFEVRFPGDRIFMGQFKFSLLDNVKLSSANNGDNWKHIGQILGRKPKAKRLPVEGEVYTCDCGRTTTGWVSVSNSKFGCFVAHKVGRKIAMPSAIIVSKTSHLQRQEYTKMHWRSYQHVWKGEKSIPHILSLVANPPAPTGKTAAAEIPKDLPKDFDWTKEVPDLGTEFDQGACGSCYSFSAVLALQMRFRIGLLVETGYFFPIDLAWQSPVRCAPYTEGCQGGFPYLVGKFAREEGLPVLGKTCAGGSDKQCKEASCPADAKQAKFFTSDYGYVGGFAQGADEALMMREIHEHGPIVMEVSVEGIPAFTSPSKGGEVLKHVRDLVPVDGASKHGLVNQWHYTTHAIICTGWGETPEGEKYWWVRNSWTQSWGSNGYAKVLRGQNAAGIETSAVWLDPDFSRLDQQTLSELIRHPAAGEVMQMKAAPPDFILNLQPTAGRKKLRLPKSLRRAMKHN